MILICLRVVFQMTATVAAYVLVSEFEICKPATDAAVKYNYSLFVQLLNL